MFKALNGLLCAVKKLLTHLLSVWASEVTVHFTKYTNSEHQNCYSCYLILYFSLRFFAWWSAVCGALQILVVIVIVIICAMILIQIRQQTLHLQRPVLANDHWVMLGMFHSLIYVPHCTHVGMYFLMQKRQLQSNCVTLFKAGHRFCKAQGGGCMWGPILPSIPAG